MTDKQISWVLFIISLLISLMFLGEIVKMNYELDNQKRKSDDLIKQIENLKKHQENLNLQLLIVNKTIASIEKDIDNTQELQRIQAQRISESIKRKK
jgi:intracellular sulfur oxidation DsrE/DsrF family protein